MTNDGFNYQVPKKPFYKKPIGIIAIVVGAFILIGIISSIAGGGGSSSSNDTGGKPVASKTTHSPKPTHSPSSPAPSKTKPAAPTGTLPMADGDWRLDTLQLKNDGLGDFGGTARITYTGSDSSGGSNVFTITVLKGSTVVATLNGSADNVQPDGTETVQLISSDSWKPGKYTYDFQTDF
jgi:hypothetical protein